MFTTSGGESTHTPILTSVNLKVRSRIQDTISMVKYPYCLWKRWASLAKWLVGRWLDVVSCVGIVGDPPYAVLHPEGGGVEWTPLEDFVGQKDAGLPVLVTEQRVDKWVTGCLAVGQTFGQHTPVRAYGPWGEELYNSTSDKHKREKKGHTPSMSKIQANSYISVSGVEDI